MAEYISREAFKEEVRRLSTHYLNEWDTLGVLAAADRIPAADVVPVRHGKWIPVTNGRGGSECNQCHAYAPSHQCGIEYKSAFCPNCGALMDKDGDGDV